MQNMFEELGERFEEKLLTVGSKFVASEAITQEDLAVDLGQIPINHGEKVLASTRLLSAQNYSLLVGLDSKEIEDWRMAYQEDPHFSKVLDSLQDPKSHITPLFPQYLYLDEGLLYFKDQNGNNRLCVP